MTVLLKEISASNWRRVLRLQPGPGDFVEEPSVSLLETVFRVGPCYSPYVRAIYFDLNLIGLTTFYPHDNECIYIHTFMIDQNYQGFGYGRRAFEQLLEYLRTELGATRVELSTKNPIAARMYESCGFRAQDDERSRIYYENYDEVLLSLNLSKDVV